MDVVGGLDNFIVLVIFKEGSVFGEIRFVYVCMVWLFIIWKCRYFFYWNKLFVDSKLSFNKFWVGLIMFFFY